MGGKTNVEKRRRVVARDVRRDAGRAMQTAADYSRQSKDEFQKNLSARLNELGAEITKLGKKGRDLKDEAKANWDRKMAVLKTKRKAVSNKVAEVGRSSEKAWKDARRGAQSAWNDLDKAFRAAWKEF